MTDANNRSYTINCWYIEGDREIKDASDKPKSKNQKYVKA